MLHEFRMPDAGEGLTEAEVLHWRVAVDDDVVVNQVLLEVETAKAAVELPSPFSGRVVALLAATGDVVPVGQPIVRIDDGLDGPSSPQEQPHEAATSGQSLLVGYGVREDGVPTRRRRRRPSAAAPAPEDGSARTPDPGSEVVARSHVARMMAKAMAHSASTAAHVTEWLDVDVTAMTRFLREARNRPELAVLPVTPLTIAALGLVRATREYPSINSSLDSTGQHLLVHHRVHLGIAVDSPRGLIVPHVADAQDLDLGGMAHALARIVQTGRAGRSRPDELRGSTITITNIGVFGVDSGTPLLNPGEVAILALGRSLPRPWVVDGAVAVRDVMTLALSFDHRVVDGALASRVLRSVADFLADPARVLSARGPTPEGSSADGPS